MRLWTSTLLFAGALLGCGGDPAGKGTGTSGGDDGGGSADDTAAPAAYAPDIFCPGGPSEDGACESNDGALHAGAAKVSITPTCFETFEDLDGDAEWDWDDEAFLDCGCDRLCPDDDGYPGPDEGEGDGDFQAVWLAGFQNARAAQGVHDELWARAIVLDQGDTRVAVVAVDLVGWFNDEVEATRTLLAERGLAVDHLVIASTHNHEGPDTMGLWGRTETRPGYDPAYTAWVHEMTADAIEQAIGDLREVGTMTVGSVDVRDFHDSQALNVVNDRRDPKVIDPMMGAAWFQDTQGETIATLAHFGNHPEAIADENGLITSDFPDQLRETMESGVTWDAYTREGLGGVSIFLNGTVGGMMTPLGITVHTPDGDELREYSFEKNDALGRVMGEMALDAIAAGDVAEDPKLSVANHEFKLFVENWGFQGMFLSGLLARETYDWDSSIPIEGDNIPKIITEVSWVRIGNLELLTIPGELMPELAVGGFDGSLTGHPDVPIIDADNPNPPDLSQAPEGPYMKDHLQAPHRWLVGMGQDELGYIVPPYNFVLDEVDPWFSEAEGDHYEETNSLGPLFAPTLDEQYTLLMGWIADNGL
jgi:hypothetical protein